MVKRNAGFLCQSCGSKYSKWMGRCANCGQWNSLVEELHQTGGAPKAVHRRWGAPSDETAPREITAIGTTAGQRMSTGIHELDRVLGGGIVAGSLGLIGGEPGIGKSTLLMQVASKVARNGGSVLYISGEESGAQLALRAQRLQVLHRRLFVAATADVEEILQHIDKEAPKLVLIDSIQTVYLNDIASPPGSVSQVREGAAAFLRMAKATGIPVILVGHVTKAGAFAGPKVLEHAVDYVLYFEGDHQHSFRLIRGVKNRFGSTNEVGIFEMTAKGLVEVENPSQLFLENRPIGSAGSAVVCAMEGTRPLLVEIQALAGTRAVGGAPRRQATGVDYQRFSMILAVLEKRQGYQLYDQDVYVNVAGGLRLDEPAADLGIALAVASSMRNKEVPADCAVIGEIGLAGEVRAVNHMQQRLRELAKLGFRRCVIPQGNKGESYPLPVSPVSTVEGALQLLFAAEERGENE